MEDKVRYILLLISVIIVLFIFVDLIFNFSNTLVENFNNPNTATPDNRGNNIDFSEIKSIVSKKDGRIFNVSTLSNDPSNKSIVIPSPLSHDSNISVNTDGTLSQQLKMTTSQSQRFELKFITGEDDFETLLESISNPETKRGLNTDSNCTSYPFFIVQSEKYKSWALTYEPGRLFLAPLGNYDNQKWDVSNIKNPDKSILTHTVENNSVGAFNKVGSNPQGEVVDPNKIKINLNLTDELKKQLFGDNYNANPGSNEDFYNTKCDTHLSSDAISSICPGCDTDKL